MKQDFHIDVYLLVFILLSVALSSLGFIFHCKVSAIAFWIPFAVLNVYALKTCWRYAIWFSGTVILLTLATAYTFGYMQIDGIEYHTPMQLLLRNGWNPIWDATMENFLPLIGDWQDLWPYHVLFLPKFNALCGAIVAKATGLWIANGFLNYVLMVVAIITAFRFARSVWPCGRIAASVFAVGIAFGRQVSSIQTGEVDYIMYAAFASAVFSGWMLLKKFEMRDMFVFFASIAIGALTKSTAIIWGGGVVFFVAVGCWKEGKLRIYSRGLLLVIFYCLIAGASPYLVNWINYGSPLYPNHTFSASIRIVDITNDFTGNEDLLSMGYLSRVAYAWVSSDWTVRFLRLVRNLPTFNPVSTVGQGGVSGLGTGFRLLLWISILCLILSRKGAAVFICLFVFCASNCAPVKYIGYSRYFPQMWIIPVLSIFNLVFLPGGMVRRMVERMRSAVVIVGVLVVGAIVFRYGILHLRMMVLEGMRQDAIAEARGVARVWFAARPHVERGDGSVWVTHFSRFGYTMQSRLRAGGIQLSHDETTTPNFKEDPMLIPCWPAMRVDYVEVFNREYPVPNTWQNLADFNWVGALHWIPHPIWSL